MMCFRGYERDEILDDEIPLATKQGLRPQCRPVHQRTRDKSPSIFSIEVEGQRACNHEPLSEAVHGSRGVVPEVIADVTNPFPCNPETIGSLGYVCDAKIRERSKPLKSWMKC
jgi:hypothetical protein